jgi:transcriptional accessory protein Tex/SPT6
LFDLNFIQTTRCFFTISCYVPFIARYRKEATGGLDEVQIKQISDEYQYVANLQFSEN